VKAIPLPSDETDEAFKYVREAVRGFPELYFARLVILAEGPSEEIVLKERNGVKSLFLTLPKNWCHP
jgi:hypothetical protein